MPKPSKVATVSQISEDLKSCDVYFFVDYRGLTFSEATELRARLAEADASLKVVKNTLAKRAAEDAGVEDIQDLLRGPTAIAYCYGDSVRVAKVLQDFIKEKKKATVRGAKLKRSLLDAAEVDSLASLPSREVLIARMVGAIASPLTRLANVTSGPIRGLVVVMGQVRDQKESAA